MYKKIILFTLISLSVISCRKDPKDVAPVDALNGQNYPKTIADLQTILTPGYSNFRSFALYGQQYLPLLLSTDHTFCSTTDGNLFRTIGGQFLTNSVTPTNNPNAQLYSFLYQGVASMNLFLDKARDYINIYGDAQHVNPLIGQAQFLRGYYLFQLECIYGEAYIDMKLPEDPDVLGVPLPTTFANTFTQANLPRSSAFKVWSQIINDFESSAANLQGIVYGPNDKGRVTEWAARGMLGKAFVFTKQYDSAKKYLLQVIDPSSGKSLMSFSQYKNAFNGDPANEFNNESLFELNVDRQPSIPTAVFNGTFYLQSLTTNQGETFAPTVISAGGLDGYGSGAQNMGGTYVQYFIHDKNLQRFGFTIAPYTLTANPNHPTGTSSTAASPALIMDPVSYQYSLNVRTNNTVDPRLFVCGLEPWVDSCEQPFQANSPGADPQAAPDTIPVGKAFIISGTPDQRAAYWGWSFKKYTTIDNNLSAYGYNDASNIYLLRLADVYLLYAEACQATGDNGTALTYVNLVHRRAYNGSTSFDYGTLNSPTLAKGANDPLANDPLKYERYVELFGEGGWWFDVSRWGIGAQEAAYYVYGTADYSPATNSGPGGSTIDPSVWQGTGKNIAAQHFPIPLVEIQSNSGMAGQRNNYPF